MWRGRGIEDDELAVCSECGGRDERLSKEYTDIGNEIPRGGMVGTVQHKVILADDGFSIFGREVASVGNIVEQGVQPISYSLSVQVPLVRV